MKKVVNLTAHKNTLYKRRGREVADAISSLARTERQSGDACGFALVVWDKDKRASCYIHTPEYSPIGFDEVPGFAHAKLLRKAVSLAVEKDFD